MLPEATVHAERRWHERASDASIDPVGAWFTGEPLDDHGLDGHEARYHADTETVLVRKYDDLVTVIDATTAKPSVQRAVDRLDATGGEVRVE
jgi:hypothetical protein